MITLLPTSLITNMNQLNALHGDEPNYPPREWNYQPPAVHFKYRTYSPKPIPVVLGIMGRLNTHDVGNDGIEIYPSKY